MNIEKKSRKVIFLLPSIVTCCSLVLGFCAMLLAVQGNFVGACIFVLISSNLDFIDGRIAKMTNSASEFGAQLDSMTDMVVFGVAPALIAWLWSFEILGHTSHIVTAASVLFVMMVALRLSRFNLGLQGKEKKTYFQGLPSPVGAILICSLIWVAEEFALYTVYISWALAVACAVSGLLMISTLRYSHRYTALITASSILMFVISESILPVFLVTLSYTLFAILRKLLLWRIQNKISQSVTPVN